MKRNIPTSRGALTRERILDAAVEVMSRLGLIRATTKEIAHAAGCSEAAIYKYFADKDDLYFFVLNERLPRFVRPLRELAAKTSDRPVADELIEVAKLAMAFYARSCPITLPMLGQPIALARNRARMAALGRGPEKADEAVAAYLRLEQQRGRVDKHLNADVAAALLIGACFRSVFLATYQGVKLRPRALSRIATEIVRTLMAIVEPK